MRRVLLVLLAAAGSGVVCAQDIITTLAGGGTRFNVDGIPATSAGLGFLTGVACDAAGNVYIADQGSGRIRKVDLGGIITTVAGGGSKGLASGVAAPATDVSIFPTSVALDRFGNIYMADQIGRVLKVDALGMISVIAGVGVGYAGDGGPALSARLSPHQGSGVAVDAAGNIYVADTDNHRIRRIDAAGIITTVAGIGRRAFSGDGGPAIAAGINGPQAVAVDSRGNLYIADYENNRIRMVDTRGIITTVAGTGNPVFGRNGGDGGPATNAVLSLPQGVALDRFDNLYIADSGNARIRRVTTDGIITTVAGVGFDLGDGGPATQANIGSPYGVAVDAAGNFYIATPVVNRVRKVTVAEAPAGAPGPNARGLGNAGDSPGACPCGDPITISNGNLFEEVTDYTTAGANALAFTRYYNSLAGGNTLAVRLGLHWRSNYDRYLRIVSASSVIAERPDGQEVAFTLNTGVWTADSDIDLRLIASGTTWTLTDADDTVETYRSSGTPSALLQSIQARTGYLQTMQYDSGNQLTGVIDSYQRSLNFTYDNGLLRSVATPDALVLTYGYTPAGDRTQLTSVTFSTSPATSLTYLYELPEMPSALTGILDENGNRYATWTYDGTGRALSSQLGDGAERTTVSYNDTDGSRTVTLPLGVQAVYKFTTLQGVPKVTEIDRVAAGGVAAAKSTFSYDSNGYLAAVTDWNGNRTTYVNDAHGQPTTTVEAAGTAQARTTTTLYHATLHLPLRTVEPGLTTAFTYDASGDLLTRTATDTTNATVPYVTNGQSRTWTYTWANALPATVKSPRTDVQAVQRFTYGSDGALTAVTNALGQTTRVTEHMPGGLPLTLVDPNGVSTTLTYDSRLRPATSTVMTSAGLLTTTYTYDPAGNLVTVTQPDGSAVTNTFDAAHRLTAVTDLSNQSIRYTLDALGNRTRTETLDAGGTRQRTRGASFDALGRLVRQTGGAGQTTTHAYDSNGNRVSVTDPLSRVTTQEFDALNRAVRITDSARGMTNVVYDAQGRPVSVTDPKGSATTYVYNGFGERIQRISPDSGTTVYRYDLNGNVTQIVDGAGSVVNYTYDALDRVLTANYPGDPAVNVTYKYDEPDAGVGVGRLTSVTDAAGTLSRTYDERGNVVSEVRRRGGVTLATAYAYDAADRLVSVGYPSNWTVDYVRDAMGRTTAVSVRGPGAGEPVPIVSSAGYQPFGPVNGLQFGNGVVETRSYDPDNRLTALSDAGTAGVQNLTYAYDAANNVTSISDGLKAASSQTFGYDTLGRLTAATGGYGAYRYTYDGLGNRLTQSLGGAATTYSYAARSNQLTAVGQQSIGYTGAGAVTNIGGMSLAYSQAGRLAAVTAGGNPVAQYTYDGFGQRLVKVGAVTGTTLYQYDRAGHLLEETDDQGSPLVDYIYLGDTPVAALAPNEGKVYFLHTDRLDTPQIATDSSQTAVWAASYGPFGEMTTTPGLIVQNLRLPGQEFDIDTGLNHNGARDYVPAWGRYLQPDPIGLAGGLNAYAYARANPVNTVDRTGKIVPVVLAVVGLTLVTASILAGVYEDMLYYQTLPDLRQDLNSLPPPRRPQPPMPRGDACTVMDPQGRSTGQFASALHSDEWPEGEFMEPPDRMEEPEARTRRQARYQNALDILGSQPLTPTGRVRLDTARLLRAEGLLP